MSRRTTSAALLSLGLFPFLSFPQTTNATIYGSVSDKSGGAIPGAHVTLTNPATDVKTSAVSNGSGEFTFTFVPVGNYTLIVKAIGFSNQQLTGIPLKAGESQRINVVLEVGEVSSSVTVRDGAPMVNTTSPEQHFALNMEQATELPTLQRDWTQLLNIGNGIVTNNDGASMNGMAANGVTFTVDGTSATADPEYNTFSLYQGFNKIKGVSLESVEEIQVTKGVVSAQNANSLGGNINVITRGGTNQIHGSVFENSQLAAYAARNQFATKRSPLVFNQFGGMLSGPVIKNKLFLFGVYEGYRERSYTQLNSNVPTKEFRDKALAVNSAFKPILDMYPLPNLPYTAGADRASYQAGAANFSNDDHEMLRGDYYFNSSSLISARYTHSRPTAMTPRIALGNPQNRFGAIDSGTISFTSLHPSWNSEFRFGLNRNSVLRADQATDTHLTGISASTISISISGERFQLDGDTRSLEEVISYSRGKHSIKFGANFVRNLAGRDDWNLNTVTYSTTADMLSNTPSSASLDFGVKAYQLQTWQLGAFIQDDYKVTRSLTVNLGLRYDYYSVPRERDGRIYNRSGLYGKLRPADSIFDADRNNFSPRLGFAWNIGGKSKTVLRGGFGVMISAHSLYAGPVEMIRNSDGLVPLLTLTRADALSLGVRYPIDITKIPLSFRQPSVIDGGTVLPNNFPDPYAFQYQLGFERQIVRSVALEVGYVGTRGVKLTMARILNYPDRITGITPRPDFQQFRYYDNSDASKYNSLQISLRKRPSHGLVLSAHYTWSRNMAWGDGNIYGFRNIPQDFNNFAPDYGPTNTDVRQRLTGNFVYQLPLAKLISHGPLSYALLRGWQVGGIFSARTGLPVNVLESSTYSGSRPDYIGGNPYAADPRSNLQYLNTAAFVRVPIITASGATSRPGNIGRNALRDMPFFNIDTALSRNFTLGERKVLQFRADMFNALNHTNFTSLQTGITNGSFGRLTAASARVVQFSMRIRF